MGTKMDKKRYKGTGPTYEQLAQVVAETTGGPMTPEIVGEVLERDLEPISDAWRTMGSRERGTLESLYKSTGDREKAISGALKDWDEQFGMPRKVVEYQTNRDMYNALKDVYDNSGGDWDMVYKVAKYNDVPKDLMNEFVKDGKWQDYRDKEFNMDTNNLYGGFARGSTGSLYGGINNALSGGKYAIVDKVPEGLSYEDQADTLWRAGVRQADAYGRSQMETSPGSELVGQLLGMFMPADLATKATAGLKASEGATRLGRIANKFVRGAASGSLFSLPESLSKESVGSALANTLKNAAIFGTGDVAISGLGEALGAFGRGAGRVAQKSAVPGENITKSFSKLKPVSEMSEAELKRGVENGWLKDGELNVTEYLAKEHGMDATQTIDDLAQVSKTNREVYNKLSSEVEGFNYKDAVKKASEDALIPNAPLSRFNKIMKELPDRLEKFSDDIIGFTEEEGVNLAQTMRSFNQQVKHELRSITKPNAAEKKAIDKYLKDIESANMMQYMKKKLPSQLKAVDKPKTVASELARIFQITNPLSAGKAVSNVLQDRVERNYLRQLMSGEAYRPSALQRMLERTGKINTEKLRPAQQIINAAISKTSKD